ncbi:hypothetical protein [Thermobrachium celere]|uniref:Uncharacterized protein n=1 Tax=Thermobrachium celere DSM 8682 TaxID=941824 RepID=R7RQG4_9CLOT|nr:hypothetical protein [Thermobrachium celere]CDF57571.1 hypothetical protein TCEL_01485 [Thermobrachium celere DSM 8682]
MYPCMIVWVPISYFEDEEDLFENIRFMREDNTEDDIQYKLNLYEMIDEEFVNEQIPKNK